MDHTLCVFRALLRLPSGARPPQVHRSPFTPPGVRHHERGLRLFSRPLIPFANVGAGARGRRAAFRPVAPHKDLATDLHGTVPDEGSGRGESPRRRHVIPPTSRSPPSALGASARVPGLVPGLAARDLSRDSQGEPGRGEECRHDPTHARPDQGPLFLERGLIVYPCHRPFIRHQRIAHRHHRRSVVLLTLPPDEEAAEVDAHLCVHGATLGRGAWSRGLLSKAEEPSQPTFGFVLRRRGGLFELTSPPLRGSVLVCARSSSGPRPQVQFDPPLRRVRHSYLEYTHIYMCVYIYVSTYFKVLEKLDWLFALSIP